MNKAAIELFVSQPALSGAIKDLEDELHIEMFIRTNRGIVITTDGEKFLGYARQMVELNKMICERYIENKRTTHAILLNRGDKNAFIGNHLRSLKW